MIRHEGRAHIRGKIRRVWRPRYLQLTDHGLVRYFEVHNNNNNTAVEQWQEPKCTLVVHSARIIDVTTFRDLHVGLPNGTFGFCFHGRRLCLNSGMMQDEEDDEEEELMACHPPSDNFVAPRDFLCAVSTLEEAQSWVVALQWAASSVVLAHRDYHSSKNSHFLWDEQDGLQWDPVLDYQNDSCGGGENALPQTRVSRRQTRNRRNNNKKNALEVMMDCSTPKARSRSTVSVRPIIQDAATTTTGVGGKIVVTKVRQHRIVRVKKWNQLTIAYDIQLLLLRRSNHKNKWTVQERMVVRTREDLQVLLEQLQSDQTLPKDDATTETLQQVQQQLEMMENLVLRRTSRGIDESIALVDTVLRKLAMDGTICNSKPLRQFWCMGSSTNNNKDKDEPVVRNRSITTRMVLEHVLDWPRLHDSHALWNKSSMETSTTTRNPNDFVKQWLQQHRQPTAMAALFQSTTCRSGCCWHHGCLYWITTHLQLSCATAVALLLLLYPMLGAYVALHMVSFRIRLDVLVFSWMVSFVFGSAWRRLQMLLLLLEQDTASFRRQLAPPNSIHVVSRATTTAPTSATREPRFEEEASLLEGSLDDDSIVDCGHSTTSDEDDDEENGDDDANLSPSADDDATMQTTTLSSPLPQHPTNGGVSCWSKPEPHIFRVRGVSYLTDRIKIPSAPEPFVCRGVDVWLTDNPERHIARHPSVLGGELAQEDTFVVNFLLPFGNFVAYFAIPPLNEFPANLRQVWSKFIKGDQQYRDARLKLLPVVVDGPWIVKKAVGTGTSPALLGKVIPLQYYFSGPTDSKKGIYEVDIIITASRIAKGILSVVKGHTNALTIAFAFIIEAAEEEELPETVLCTFQLHALELERCPQLPEYSFDEV